jgi:hypothetical protein
MFAMKRWFLCLFAWTLAAHAGCASPSEAVPSIADDELAPAQIINSNGWTAEGHEPFCDFSSGLVSASATFTGPSARRMGVCLLQLTTTPCSSVAQCNSAPSWLPPNGFRYCTAPNGVGQKYCAFRPGSQATFCAGTPATAGNPPVAPGNFYTNQVFSALGGTRYVSYACFEGCTATDPSVSSQGMMSCYATHNGNSCQDYNCDGIPDVCGGYGDVPLYDP